jgi:hypothetical protein
MGLVYCAITTANISIGYGKHAYVLDTKTVEKASFLNSLSFLFGIISFAVPKLAVAAMLNRILNPSYWQKMWVWIISGTGAVISAVCIVMLFTMCDPPHALWETSLVIAGKATCRDVWILIDYAIFTGGEWAPSSPYSPCEIKTILTDQRHPHLSTCTLQCTLRRC